MRQVKEIRTSMKLTQAAFAERYDIPLRTLQSWESGERIPAPYIVRMLDRLADLDKTPVYAWYLVGVSEGDGITERMTGIEDEIDAKRLLSVRWGKLSEADKKSYSGEMGAFFAGLYRLEWDGYGWAPEGDPVKEIFAAE